MVLLAFAESFIQLVPDGTLIYHVALILAMIWTLNRTFFRPINRIIESREKSRGGHSSEAEGILQEVSDKTKRFDAALLDARSAGYELIEKERSAAVARREAELERVKSEIAEKVAKEREELERQTAEAKAHIAKEAETMAEKISSSFFKTA